MLLHLLQLPAACLTEQKIPKKGISEHAKNSNPAARLLQQTVQTIHLLAHITPNNSNIASYADQEHEYLEAMHISLLLKEEQVSAGQLKSLHQLLHQSIAYPLILEIRDGSRAQWSLAEKAINQANPEHEQLVIRDLVVTDWQSSTPQNVQLEFQQSLSFPQLDHGNLMALYRSLLARFVNYLKAVSLGQTSLSDASTCSDADLVLQRDQLRRIQELQQRIRTLQARREACSQFNEKVAINLELQKLTRELKEQ